MSDEGRRADNTNRQFGEYTEAQIIEMFRRSEEEIDARLTAALAAWDAWEDVPRPNVVVLTHLPDQLFPKFDPHNGHRYRALRNDNGVQYTVVVAYDFTPECVRFHIDRAKHLREAHNSSEELYMIIRLFGEKYRQTPKNTRSTIITAICEYLNESNLDYRTVAGFANKLCDDTKNNFDVMTEFIEQLGENMYTCFVMQCAISWTHFAYENPIVKNCLNARYFTEQLSENQMKNYLDDLHRCDVNFTTFLVRCIFPDWLDDENFQSHLLYWLASGTSVPSIAFCITEIDDKYGVNFYREVVINTLVRLFATTYVRNAYQFTDTIIFMIDKFELSDSIVNLISRTIDKMHYNPFDENLHRSWHFVFTLLMVKLAQTTNTVDYELSKIWIMRRFMETGNYYMMKTFYFLFFHHVNETRMMIHCFNWANPDQLIMEPVPHFFAEAMYYDLSQDEKNMVFSAMCKEENIPALHWMISHDYEQFFNVNVVDGKLVSFSIREEPFNVVIFARYSFLGSYGMTVRNIEDIQYKRDECIVCMEQLDEANIVVPNCHSHHQMCETCCLTLIQETHNCPMCRGEMVMNECSVFVL